MTISEIGTLLDASVCTEPEDGWDTDINVAYSADVMSDVLAYATEGCILITGLRNPQVIRTAEMKDVPCIIFTRGKQPDSEVMELARCFGICTMVTKLSTFNTSGLLYQKGIRGTDTL